MILKYIYDSNQSIVQYIQNMIIDVVLRLENI